MTPQVDELKYSILDSHPDNWIFFDMPQTWVHQDEMLKIKTIGEDGWEGYRDIDQPDFANLNDDEHDQETQVRMLYQGTPFDQLPVLRLDGGRIRMVKPDRDPNNGARYLTEYEAHISQIMSMDDFMSRQGGVIDIEIR